MGMGWSLHRKRIYLDEDYWWNQHQKNVLRINDVHLSMYSVNHYVFCLCFDIINIEVYNMQEFDLFFAKSIYSC